MATNDDVLGLLGEFSGDDTKLRIAAAFVAYACGDAFGYAYEFEPIVRGSVPNELLTKDGWPAGGVSDDTLLSLMTVECLSAPSAMAAGEMFLQKLKAAAGTLRGLGPTTRNALGLPVKASEQHLIGISNGGLMRCALLGLAFTDDATRDQWVEALCSVTHPVESAIAPAREMAFYLARVLDGSADPLPDFTTSIPQTGVPLDPQVTLRAAQMAGQADSVFAAFTRAVNFGGDTDTVCAIGGAIAALKNPSSVAALPWLQEVDWAEIPQLRECINLVIDSRDRVMNA